MRPLPACTAVLLFFCALWSAVGLADQPPVTVPRPGPETRKSRVLIIVRDDCPKCDAELARLREPGGPFEAMQAVGWKIDSTPDSHVQIVNRDDVPEVAKTLDAADYPAVAAVDGEEVIRYFETGCTTPLDAWTFGWLMTGKNERPTAVVPEPVRVASTARRASARTETVPKRRCTDKYDGPSVAGKLRFFS